MLKKIIQTSLVMFFLLTCNNAYAAFNIDQCMRRAENIGKIEENKCRTTNTLKNLQEIQTNFNTFANDKDFKALDNQELKITYDAWIIHRDNFCKIYSYAQNKDYDDLDANGEYIYIKCIDDFTKRAWLYIRASVDGLYSDPD